MYDQYFHVKPYAHLFFQDKQYSYAPAPYIHILSANLVVTVTTLLLGLHRIFMN